MKPRFFPHIEELADRITPTLGFGTLQNYAVGVAPNAVAVGDFNGDGRQDIAGVNSSDGTVSVLLNTTPIGTSTPTYAAAQTFAVGNTPLYLVVGDFNGDGREDIAVTNNGAGTGNTISVLVNTTPVGSSALSFTQQTFTVGTGPYGIAAGDFNGDGRSDLVVTNYGTSAGTTVSVLLNTTPMQSSTVSFTAAQTFTVGTGPWGVAVGDLNADGLSDIVVANSGSNSVSVLMNTSTLGTSTVSFATQQTFTVGTTPIGIALADFNGDGRLDIVTTNEGANTVSVLVNQTSTASSTATFAAKQDYTVGANPYSVTTGDYDGNGRTDIAVVNAGANTVSVLLNQSTTGSSTLTFATKQDFAVGSVPVSIASGDFNGDGLTDITVANSNANTTSILVNTSTGVQPTTTSPALVAQFGTSGGVWAFNRPTGAWVELTGANATALAASASGNVVASFGGNGLWYYRAAGGTWTQLNGNAAVALAIDPLGNAYVSFAGFGTYEYRLSTGMFEQIGASVANLLAVSANGNVVGNFPGFGVYLYQRKAAIPFHQINGFNANALAINSSGYVAASFNGFGVGEYIPYASGWRTVAPAVVAPSVAIDNAGNIYASFPGLGVSKFGSNNQWQNIAPAAQATSLAVDWYGNVFASFSGFQGVWEYDPSFGWQWKEQNAVTVVALAS